MRYNLMTDVPRRLLPLPSDTPEQLLRFLFIVLDSTNYDELSQANPALKTLNASWL